MGSKHSIAGIDGKKIFALSDTSRTVTMHLTQFNDGCFVAGCGLVMVANVLSLLLALGSCYVFPLELKVCFR